MKNNTKIGKGKWFIKHYSKIFVVLGLLLILVSQFSYHASKNRNLKIDVESAERKIDEVFLRVENLAERWFKAEDGSVFINGLWSKEKDENLFDDNTSLLFFDQDSLVLWDNYIYSEKVLLQRFSEKQATIILSEAVVVYRSLSEGSRSLAVIICLDSPYKGLNSDIFDETGLTILPYQESDTHKSQLNYSEKYGFNVEIKKDDKEPAIPIIMGWTGLLLCLIGIKRIFRSRTTIKNSFRISVIFLVFIGTIILLLISTDLIVSKQSLGDAILLSNEYVRITMADLFIIYMCLIIYGVYIYRIRYKFRQRYPHLNVFWQSAVVITSVGLLNLFVISFHCALVTIIYSTPTNVELYKFTLIETNTILLYLTCGIFIANKILINAAVRTIYNNKYTFLILGISLVSFLLMLLPFVGRLHDTMLIAILFQLLFIAVAYWGHTRQKRYFFIPVASLCTIYIMVLTIMATSVSNDTNVRNYAQVLLEGDTEGLSINDDDFRKLYYLLLSDKEIVTREGGSMNLFDAISRIENNCDTIIKEIGYKYYLFHDTKDHEYNRRVVISAPQITFLGGIACFIYTFVTLYVITVLFLKLSGYNSVLQKSPKGCIAMRIRFYLIGVVLFTMTLVLIVGGYDALKTYDSSQRKAMFNDIRTIHNSFLNYALNKDITDQDLQQWFVENNDLVGHGITIYNLAGDALNTTSDLEVSYSKMNSEAYKALAYEKLPYLYSPLVVGRNQYNSIYAPVRNDHEICGYVFYNEPVRHDIEANPRYDAITHLVNIMVIVLFFAVIFSILLYRRLSRRFNKLQRGMEQISTLKHIEEDNASSDEISLLIKQYNRMVDYLEESYEKLAASERESAWRYMAQQVAHEIKNPLTPMQLKIQMLQRAKAKDDENLMCKIDDTLDLLLEQIDLLARIASEFSDFAKIKDAKFQTINVSELLDSINRLYSDGDVFKVEPVSDEWYVRADLSQLKRVLINLCQNAFQAIEDNGDETKYVILRAKRIKNSIRFSVSDSGIGVKEEHKEKVFFPNFTTKSNGTGLGLAISRQIIINAGGSLWFENNEDRGTTFFFTLPLYMNSEQL